MKSTLIILFKRNLGFFRSVDHINICAVLTTFVKFPGVRKNKMALILLIAIYTASGHNYRFHPPSLETTTINADPSLGYVNVKAPPYNAVGNGVTDDTNAVQQALNDIGVRAFFYYTAY
jgi:hypothetical protein